VTHRPADDLAQDIAPAFVGRQHPVADQEGDRPQVVGNDPERNVGLVPRTVFGLHLRSHRLDQRLKEIGLEVALHRLQNGRHPLQTHPGVDTGVG